MATQTAVAAARPTTVGALRTVHRLEVGPLYFFVLVWGMFTAANHPSDLWAPASILAFLINGLSLFSGFVLNSYSDYPIDLRSPIKYRVAHSVEAIGLRVTLVIYTVEQIVTIGLAVAVSIMLNNWAFVFVKLLGILAGYLYNANPIRLKRRGMWNPIMMAIRFGFVPGLIAYLAVHHGTIRAGGWILLTGMTLMSFSRGFWNAVSDTDEDAAENIATPSVAYGPVATIRTAVAILFPATALVFCGLWMLFDPIRALIGTVGAVGALVYRISLLRSATDDRSTISLLQNGPIRKTDAKWSKATYYMVIIAGMTHFLAL